MTREEQRALLIGYTNYLAVRGCAVRHEDVDAFLATRQPCSCSHCEVASERDKPQRFWRVVESYLLKHRGTGYLPGFRAVECHATGERVEPDSSGVLRATREEAEADGAASGLSRWEDKR